MFVTNLLKFVWEKVYFNVDLPVDRDKKCEKVYFLEFISALLEFLLPTTKPRKVSGGFFSYMYYKDEYLSRDKHEFGFLRLFFIYLVDLVLLIPRLVANILKLITEVLPLLLRELTYAAFQSMLKKVQDQQSGGGLTKKLYQAAALICWGFTSLFSFVYFVGCLLTSPGRTIPAILETFNKLGLPVLGAVLALACAALVFCFHFTLLMIGLGFTFPSVALLISESGWVGALAASLLMLVDGFGGFIFNTNPNNKNLIVGFDKKKTDYEQDHRLPMGAWKLQAISCERIVDDTNVSIPPNEFRKIFSDDYEPIKCDVGNRPHIYSDEELFEQNDQLVFEYRRQTGRLGGDPPL